jgi:chitinase
MRTPSAFPLSNRRKTRMITCGAMALLASLAVPGAPRAAILAVYGDQPAQNWQARATPCLDGKSSTHESVTAPRIKGTHSFHIHQVCSSGTGFVGFDRKTSDGSKPLYIAPNKFNFLDFWVNDANQGASLNGLAATLYPQNSSAARVNVGKYVVASTKDKSWHRVRIPLSVLNPNGTSFYRVYFRQNATQASDFYLDDIRFDTGKWVTAFYPGYQVDLLRPEEIDFSVLTHLVVGMVFPRSDGTLDPMFMWDDAAGEQLARDLVNRAHGAGKKAIMMLGGAGAQDFPSALSDANRGKFVANVVSYAKGIGFDGVDLDYEENLNYGLAKRFVADFKAAWPGGLLTFDAFWVNKNFKDDIDPQLVDIAKMVDQFNVMTYVMADAWGWQSWHSSAIYGEQPLYPSSVSSTVDAYVAKGVPVGKIGIGIGSFGSCWGQPVTGPRQDTGGSYVRASDNEMSYSNIRDLYYSAQNYFYDDIAETAFLSYPTPKGANQCTFISYENQRSVAAKGAYVRKKGAGGVILWTLGEGYRRGAGNPNEFLYALRNAFLGDHSINRAPAAAAIADRVSGNTPLTVTFNASLSSDPDGDKLTYAWNFADGGTGSGQIVKHTFTNTGTVKQTFDVVLTVSDGKAAAKKTLPVTVNPPGLVEVAAPSNLSAKTSGISVMLNWKDNSDNEDNFYIERAASGSGTYLRVGQVGQGVTAYTDTPPAGTYDYRVRAFNAAASKLSAASNKVTVVASGQPTPDLVLYQNGVIAGQWSDGSWNPCNDYDLFSTAVVMPGHGYSYRFSETCVWGGAGFYLTDQSQGAMIDPVTYRKIIFNLNPGSDVEGLNHVWMLLVNGSAVRRLSDFLPASVSPNTWIQVTIPVTELNSANAPYNQLFFQTDVDTPLNAPITFYLDNLILRDDTVMK